MRMLVLDWNYFMKYEIEQAARAVRIDASTMILKRAMARWQQDTVTYYLTVEAEIAQIRMLVLDWNGHMRHHFKEVHHDARSFVNRSGAGQEEV